MAARNYSNSYACLLTGLPWQSSERDVTDFLGDVIAKSIAFQNNRQGRFSGNVLVNFATRDDLNATLEKSGEYIGTRYVNVKEMSGADEQGRESGRESGDNDGVDYDKVDESCLVVRIRGVPWRVTSEQIDEFFRGIRVKDVDYLHFKNGLFSGTLYVELETRDDYYATLDKSKETMGGRYVEVFPSSAEVRDRLASIELSCTVKMLNMPYDCAYGDIRRFFRGLNIAENGITIPMNAAKRPLGIALVQFASAEDANEALNLHEEVLNERQVYLQKWTQLTKQNTIPFRRRTSFSDVPKVSGQATRGRCLHSPGDRRRGPRNQDGPRGGDRYQDGRRGADRNQDGWRGSDRNQDGRRGSDRNQDGWR